MSELPRAASCLADLADLAHALESAQDASSRVRRALGALRRVVPNDRCALVNLVSRSVPRSFVEPALEAPDEERLLAKAARLLELVSDHPARELNALPGQGTAPRLAVPLVALDDVAGLLLVERDAGAFDAQDLQLLSVVASQLGAYLASLRLHDDERRATEALRDADRRKSEFLGVLSHELRNPLAPIRYAMHILERAPAGSEQANRARAVIERQTSQLTRLVDDLLDVTRITRGKIELRRSRVDLTALLHQVVEDHRPIFASRDIGVNLRIDAGPQWIDADPARIAQAIGNVLGNAAKFTNAHGHVVVTVRRDGDHAAIQVADDGIGLSAEMLARVFEPFTQADESLHRAYGGLGLGLALVKGLVELHDGRVEVRSHGPGMGTEFTISIPLLLETGAPVEEPAAPVAAVAARLRVLIVEDNLDTAETLEEVLEMSGHEVAVAHDGEGGVATASAFDPDVVLCDIGLSGLDGYEVARRIRANPAIRPTLVAVTGYTRPEDQRESFRAGFDRHLGKPIQIVELDAVLATVSPRPAEGAERPRRDGRSRRGLSR